jgi:hypothetical protein
MEEYFMRADGWKILKSKNSIFFEKYLKIKFFRFLKFKFFRFKKFMEF